MSRGRRLWLGVFLVACGNASDAGQDAGSDVAVVIDAGKDTSTIDAPATNDSSTNDAGAFDAPDDVAPIPCTLTLSGAVSGTLDCVAHGTPYSLPNMEQLSIEAKPTTSVPYGVLVTCNEYTPIQTITYNQTWSSQADDGCTAIVTETFPDGGQGQKWFVDRLGTDAGWVSMTLTYLHQTQTIYMTIDGHADSYTTQFSDAGFSAVNIQATF